MLPSVATKAKASGTPPKLARTPDAVSTASRSPRKREDTTAWASGRPKAVARAADTADSFTLPSSAVRYAPLREAVRLSTVYEVAPVAGSLAVNAPSSMAIAGSPKATATNTSSGTTAIQPRDRRRRLT